MTDDISELPPPNCPALPVELWGKVFTHLDDFTVWMRCRNVSKMWRAEAESEFARTRLLHLYFKREFCLDSENDCVIDSVLKGRPYMGWCKTVRMTNVPTKSERVSFDVRFKYRLYDAEEDRDVDIDDDDDKGTYVEPWVPELTESIRKQLTDFDHLDEERDPTNVFIGDYANDIDILGLEIDFDNHRISFLWTSFLSAFFQDEDYVRRQRKALGFCHAEYPLLVQLRDIRALPGKDIFKRWFVGEDSPATELDTELYKQAFAIRIGKTDHGSYGDSHVLCMLDYWSKRLQRARRRYLRIHISQFMGSWNKKM
jgi:hypothetical protein